MLINENSNTKNDIKIFFISVLNFLLYIFQPLLPVDVYAPCILLFQLS